MKRITLLHLGIALALTPACGDDGIPVSETEEGTDDTGTADTTASPTQSTTITTTGTPPTTGETEDPPDTTGDTEDPPDTTGPTTTGDPTTGDPTTGDTEADTGSTGPGELCGNGEIDGDEECDDGEENADTAACKSDCTDQVCGDTFMGPDEACDDGNTESNDGCSSMCLEDGGATCEAPYYVEALPYSHDGDTTMAGNDYSFDTCGGFSGNEGNTEATYAFTPTDDGIYTVTATSAVDLTLYIGTDCADTDGSCVGAVDDFAANGTEAMFVTGVADTTYFIHTGHYSDGGATGDGEYTLTVDLCIPTDCDGSFCGDDGCGGTCSCAEGEICDESGDAGMCAPEPAGDTCEEPIVVDETMLPFSDDGDTLLYANDYGYSSGSCPGEGVGYNSGAEDVVYEFTPAVAGVYTIAMDATFDSVMYIVTDCADIDNSCFQAVDGGNPETIVAALEAGTTYYIIGGHWSNSTPGSGGEYTLTISDVCTPVCTDGVCGEDDSCGGTCGCDDGEFCDEADGTPGTCEVIPVGDTCDDAAMILPADLPYSDVGDTLVYENDYSYGAGACPGESGGGSGASSEVVYTFTPDTSGLYDIAFDPDPSFDSTLWIATDCDDIDGTCVAAADNGNPETIQADLVAGTTYFFFGGAWSNSTSDIGGEYTFTVGDVCVPTCDEVACNNDNGCGGTCGCADGDVCIDDMCEAIPTGDTCEDPILVGGLPYTDSGDTLVYTNNYSYGSGVCPGETGGWNDGAEDVVYSFTPAADGDYLIDFNATWDSTVYVVTDCADIDNTCVGGADNSGTGSELVTATLTGGTTYFIVGGHFSNFTSGTGGAYTLDITAL